MASKIICPVCQINITEKGHICQKCYFKKIRARYYCIDCKKQVSRKDVKRCKSCANKKEKNPAWKGGKVKKSSNYYEIKNESHPFSTKRGYVSEHRLVMEKYLKRYLKPNEVVHHIDGNRLNNKIANLILFNNQSEHISLHNLKNKKQENEFIKEKKKIMKLERIKNEKQ